VVADDDAENGAQAAEDGASPESVHSGLIQGLQRSKMDSIEIVQNTHFIQGTF
jgi:hypothetical protein